MNDPGVRDAIIAGAGPVHGPFIREYLQAAWREDDPAKVYVIFNLPMPVSVLGELVKRLNQTIRKVYGRRAQAYFKTEGGSP